jgi:DNA-binding MurR/RpiR family transcriptional regulator
MPAASADPQIVSQSQRPPPKDLSEIKQRIVSGEVVFSDGSERFLRTVLADPALVAFGTVESVARACSVSPATLARAVHACGFTGFRDMRTVFRQHVRHLGGRDDSQSN